MHVASREKRGDARSGGRVHIEDHAAFDVATDVHHGGNAFPAIDLLLHGNVANAGFAAERLGQHGIGGVNERLNQFHLHDCTSAAAASEVAASPMT